MRVSPFSCQTRSIVHPPISHTGRFVSFRSFVHCRCAKLYSAALSRSVFLTLSCFFCLISSLRVIVTAHASRGLASSHVSFLFSVYSRHAHAHVPSRPPNCPL